MLKLKQGVSWGALQPEGLAIRKALEDICGETGYDLTVTCTTEGHPDTDPHTHGFAIDIRTLDLTKDVVADVARRLASLLGSNFYLQYEVTEDMLAGLPASLVAIAHVNPASTAPHLHTQYRKGLWQAALITRQGASHA